MPPPLIPILPAAILGQSLLFYAFSDTNCYSLAAILSIQLRFAAYTFLRWIPAHHGPQAVPLLFLLSSLAWKNWLNHHPFPTLSLKDHNNLPPSLPPDHDHHPNQPHAQNHDSTNSQSEFTPLLPKPSPPRPRTTLFTILRSLLGLPTHSVLLNRLAFLINLLLTLFVLDATFTPLLFYPHLDLAFVRVGAVGETWAKVHARLPPGNPAGDGAEIIYRPMEPVGAWNVGPSLVTSNVSDWTAVARIDGLWPGTAYEYRLAEPGSPTTYHARFPSAAHFKTAPDSSLIELPRADGGSFTFAYTSCIKPGFPYNPFRDPLHNDGALQLYDHVLDSSERQPIEFIIFLGDFIYADSPIYPGHHVENYWRKYRQSYAGEGWSKLIQATRLIHIYDDHEIYNDYAGNSTTSPLFESANRAYRDYLGSANFDGPGHGENYYWFRYADAAFFVWDCRRYRSKNEMPDGEGKSMLGKEQKEVFFEWLKAVNETVTFKFVISSTPFMSLWLGPDGALDTWAGFLYERNELVDKMEWVKNLIVLSGDRHEFATATIREKIYEFSTSPLNQFWLPIKTLNQENGLGKVGEEKVIKYIPEGNRKFSSLKVDCKNVREPKVEFKLFIDGKLTYQLSYLGQPIRKLRGTGRGTGWTSSSKEVLSEKIYKFCRWDEVLKVLRKPIKWVILENKIDEMGAAMGSGSGSGVGEVSEGSSSDDD